MGPVGPRCQLKSGMLACAGHMPTYMLVYINRLGKLRSISNDYNYTELHILISRALAPSLVRCARKTDASSLDKVEEQEQIVFN